MKDLCILHNHVVSMLFMMESIEFWKQKWKYNFCIKNIEMEGTNKRHIQLVYKASKPSTHSISLSRIADLNLIFLKFTFFEIILLDSFCFTLQIEENLQIKRHLVGIQKHLQDMLKALNLHHDTLFAFSVVLNSKHLIQVFFSQSAVWLDYFLGLFD